MDPKAWEKHLAALCEQTLSIRVYLVLPEDRSRPVLTTGVAEARGQGAENQIQLVALLLKLAAQAERDEVAEV